MSDPNNVPPELAMQAAAREGNVEEVQSLLASGVDVNSRNRTLPDRDDLATWRDMGSFEMEDIWGDDIVNALNGEKCEANLGWAALHLAVRFGHLEVVNLLITERAEVNIPNRFGERPLHCACDVAFDESEQTAPVVDVQVELVRTLIAAGADVNAESANDDLPIHYAASVSKGEQLVAMLLEGGSEVNTRNKRSELPLQIAIELHNEESVKSILDSGKAKLTLKMGKKDACQFATKSGTKRIATMLADAGGK